MNLFKQEKPKKRLSVHISDELAKKITEWRNNHKTQNFSALVREYIRKLIEESK